MLFTDGITEALESGPLSIDQALNVARSTKCGSPAEICDSLMRSASEGTGPVGVQGWQDDRTVLVFAVEPAKPPE